MQAGTRREMAVVLGALITIGFFLIIPMICPGFPAPAVRDIRYSSASLPDGTQHFSLTGTVTNEGTRGNVVVTAKLVNASSGTVAAKSTATFFMMPGENKAVSMSVSGRTTEPYDLVLEARRK
jgi:hypothetical protein